MVTNVFLGREEVRVVQAYAFFAAFGGVFSLTHTHTNSAIYSDKSHITMPYVHTSRATITLSNKGQVRVRIRGKKKVHPSD